MRSISAAGFLLMVGACPSVRAHDVITTKVTWSREISRLFQRRCFSCHGEAGSAFSLRNYAEARPWAKAIKEEVLTRRMPPWGAVKGFGSFRDDRGLTQEELEIVSDWVEGGAPEGDPALLPHPSPAAAALLPPVSGTGIVVEGRRTLMRPFTVAAIRVQFLPESGSVQTIAEFPDGAIAPLIWIYDYKPQFDRTYYLEEPLRLPPGTVIRCYPPKPGAILLLAARPEHLLSGLKGGR